MPASRKKTEEKRCSTLTCSALYFERKSSTQEASMFSTAQSQAIDHEPTTPDGDIRQELSSSQHRRTAPLSLTANGQPTQSL